MTSSTRPSCRSGAVNMHWMGSPDAIAPLLQYASFFFVLRVVVGWVVPRAPWWLGGDSYRAMPTAAKRAMFCNKIVSSVHAAGTVLGVYGSMAELFLRTGGGDAAGSGDEHEGHDFWHFVENPVYTPCRSCELVMLFTLGYFIEDGLDCITHRTKDWHLVLVHHFVATAGFWATIATRCCSFWAAVLLLMEASTIPLNIRWLMAKAQLKHTAFYTIVGLFLFASFLVFRIVLSYVVLIHYHLEEDVKTIDVRIYATWLLNYVLLLVLNTVWFIKMVRIGWRVLMNPVSEPNALQAKKKKL